MFWYLHWNISSTDLDHRWHTSKQQITSRPSAAASSWREDKRRSDASDMVTSQKKKYSQRSTARDCEIKGSVHKHGKEP